MNQTIFAIVPVKALARSKTRLAPVLSVAQRARLTATLLARSLDVTGTYPGSERTIVVSADPDVRRIARQHGATAIPEVQGSGINCAVDLGCRLALHRGATAALFMPIDLPLTTASDLRHFCRASGKPVIRIATDRHGIGTNAIYLQPPHLKFAQFGSDSLRQHCLSARGMGIGIDICNDDALSFDIDTPEDLSLLLLKSPRFHNAWRSGFADQPGRPVV